MSQYIVTDLTRFKEGNKDVCTAVIDMDTGQCLRPIPYLTNENVKELNMHPGAILKGDISLDSSAQNPHIEDAKRGKLEYYGPASGEAFKAVLDRSLSRSVAIGFGISLAENQKHIPVGVQANCSIITVKLLPAALTIHEDPFNSGRIKASFTDPDGHYFGYLSITDRGFFDYAKKHQNDGMLADVRKFIHSQKELYLRVGVGRRWYNGTHDGYWMQVNGIYTFPNFFEQIRKY